MIPFFHGQEPSADPRSTDRDDKLRELLREPLVVEKPVDTSVAKFYHGAADPPGSVRTCPDEETR
jgi:hypothetical protein